MLCGIPGFGVQDQESQGAIVDRTGEHLGTSDSAIIKVRRRLLSAARVLRDHGTSPPGQEPAAFLVHSASVVVPPDAGWAFAATPRILVRPGQSLQLA